MKMYCTKCDTYFGDVALIDVHSKRFCYHCGEPLREELVSENGEIFIKALLEDDILSSNYHLGCGGIVNRSSTSTPGIDVYACSKCYLRIYEQKGE